MVKYTSFLYNILASLQVTINRHSHLDVMFRSFEENKDITLLIQSSSYDNISFIYYKDLFYYYRNFYLFRKRIK